MPTALNSYIIMYPTDFMKARRRLYPGIGDDKGSDLRHAQHLGYEEEEDHRDRSGGKCMTSNMNDPMECRDASHLRASER